MQTRTTGWECDDDDDDYEPECVTTVDDGFERGAALQSLWIHVRAREFRSGRVTAVLTGVTVDLREATLSPEGATIHVQSALSGIDILVPPDWDVAWDVGAIWSSVGEHRRAPRSAEPRPRLRIAGMVVAGGLSVR
ncbi:MAG TPA: LiaF domain-containing protein [Polyangia bacterium]|jgi:predicted membrane protein|nr:LiaF domain-containing protein [Polyangia bacterium]